MCAFLTSCSMKRRILGIEAVWEGRLRLDAEIEVIQSCALCQHPCKTLCPDCSNLIANGIEAVGEGRLRASWRGQASGLVL